SVLALKIDFPWDTPSHRLTDFRSRALAALATLPGVRAVGVADRLPLEGGSQSGPLAVAGAPLAPELAARSVSHRAASAGDFPALGIPLLSGRLPRQGLGSATREALVNATLARLYFPDGRALGRRITFDVKPDPGKPPRWLEVVGIVGDVRLTAAQPSPVPEVFVLPEDTYWPLLRFVVRGTGEPAALAAAARQAISRVDPGQVVDGITPLEDEVDRSTAEPRTRVWLLGAFALLALWLAALGLYGVLASDVVHRTHEIGVRLALGADRARVLREVLWRGLSVALLGLAPGLLVSAALGRWLGALLYEVKPLDPAVLLGVSAVILAVATAASDLPARRASGVDPSTALRHE
ncbi:MAG TPA: FtsX-like permease family protein, partial [Thermoanaerobaculia bacterium]|nr:FtsX-like permease family protein [Thermoanaerobaculia bacterium]